MRPGELRARVALIGAGLVALLVLGAGCKPAGEAACANACGAWGYEYKPAQPDGGRAGTTCECFTVTEDADSKMSEGERRCVAACNRRGLSHSRYTDDTGACACGPGYRVDAGSFPLSGGGWLLRSGGSADGGAVPQ